MLTCGPLSFVKIGLPPCAKAFPPEMVPAHEQEVQKKATKPFQHAARAHVKGEGSTMMATRLGLGSCSAAVLARTVCVSRLLGVCIKLPGRQQALCTLSHFAGSTATLSQLLPAEARGSDACPHIDRRSSLTYLSRCFGSLLGTAALRATFADLLSGGCS